MDKPKLADHCECDQVGATAPERECEYLPEEKLGMNHAPNECKCINGLKLYKVKGKDEFVTLCSCCNLSYRHEEVTNG